MSGLYRQLVTYLGAQLAVSAEGMLNEAWTAEPGPQAVAESIPLLCWAQKLNLYKEPLLQIAVARETAVEIGARALRAAGIEEPEENDSRTTYIELLTQALAGFARHLSEECGSEILLESGAEVPVAAAASGSPFAFQTLQVTGPQDWSATFYVRIEPILLHTLGGTPEPDSAPPPETRPSTALAVRGPGAAAAPAHAFDLLLDVEMPVSISFGKTQMPLKDVIKLNTGSIVELNRTLSEPVEIIINNCVIARGEVVVVDGNYGVRIQHIVSRAERLRSVD
jgi:flagellar motor switch protein FliN